MDSLSLGMIGGLSTQVKMHIRKWQVVFEYRGPIIQGPLYNDCGLAADNQNIDQ